MNKISTKQKYELAFDSFEGIDTRMDKTSEHGCSYISNFRIAPDGSLEKRYGYRTVFTFDAPIRAVWTGKLDGVFKGYALIGKAVMLLNFQTELSASVGEIDTDSGDATFFYYRSKLYLIDGKSIYIIGSGGITAPYGYIPLVGKDWPVNTVGEIYQSPNLLNDRARITYAIKTDGSAYLKTDENIVSIDRIFVNGVKIDEDRYSLSIVPRTVFLTELKAGDHVELCYRYQKDTSFTAELLSCKKAMVFGAITNSRPFLWGGNDKTVMYNAAYVSIADLYASRKTFGSSDELYFPFGHEFTVGDGRYPISAVSRHYDRLLIFTEGGAWMADSSACGIEEFPLMRINSAIGVASEDAATTVGNQPCSVGLNSIYRWTSNTDELDECNAYSISDGINGLLPADFFTTAFVFHDGVKGEILFGSPKLENKVLVYNTSSKCWTVFEGISADRFIDCGSDVGFIKGTQIFVFDKSCTVDKGVAEKEINAAFYSNTLDFGTDSFKHMRSVSAGYFGTGISLELYFDGKDAPECTTSLTQLTKYSTVKKRVSAKRFKTARFALRATGRSTQRIYSLCINTR
ncbi:MAG: hypothetical protein E7653_06965 [Ruminococcaceae bacterium]|nr:hypothetical protein [Oscillospiraceae bacterium]